MNKIKYLSLILFLTMAGAIAYAMITGDFFAEGDIILSLSWGIVSMVDLSIGFTLFVLWIWYRQGLSLSTILWTIGMYTLGFMTGAFYVFVIASQADGDWDLFWKGKNTNTSSNN